MIYFRCYYPSICWHLGIAQMATSTVQGLFTGNVAYPKSWTSLSLLFGNSVRIKKPFLFCNAVIAVSLLLKNRRYLLDLNFLSIKTKWWENFLECLSRYSLDLISPKREILDSLSSVCKFSVFSFIVIAVFLLLKRWRKRPHRLLQ